MFHDVNFSISIPSRWNAFFLLLQIPTLFLLALLAIAFTGGVVETMQKMPVDVRQDDIDNVIYGFPLNKVFLVCSYIIILIILWLIYILIIWKSIKSIRKMRRYARQPLTALSDVRPPVLFLRSFSAESEENPDRVDQRTPEELLVKVLGGAGPVVTVGTPGEEGLPVLGAQRIYIDKDWQPNVLKLCAISNIVIIDADTTNGVRWEMENVRNFVNPRRVLVSFFSKQEAPDYSTEPLFNRRSFEQFYNKFSDSFAKSFGQPLPDYDPNTFLICFDDNWNPYPIIISTKSNRSIFKFNITALKPKKYVSISSIWDALAFFFSNLDTINIRQEEKPQV